MTNSLKQTIMKRWTTLLMMIGMLGMTIPAMGAMSLSKVRKNTRFLTDRMAYELHLSQQQYNDVYEVNFDFINNVRYIMDDVARGYGHAMDRYYDFLDIRNDDLRWILSGSQYRRFMDTKYFYRPIYTSGRKWDFGVFTVYTNWNHFYFGKPYHYSSYKGGHCRKHFDHVSYYRKHHHDRYHHDVYSGNFLMRPHKPQHKPSAPHVKPGKPNKPQMRPNGNKNDKPQVRPNNHKKNERPNQSQARPARTDKKQNSTLSKPSEQRIQKRPETSSSRTAVRKVERVQDNNRERATKQSEERQSRSRSAERNR